MQHTNWVNQIISWTWVQEIRSLTTILTILDGKLWTLKTNFRIQLEAKFYEKFISCPNFIVANIQYCTNRWIFLMRIFRINVHIPFIILTNCLNGIKYLWMIHIRPISNFNILMIFSFLKIFMKMLWKCDYVMWLCYVLNLWLWKVA